jgi:hypothetical protein
MKLKIIIAIYVVLSLIFLTMVYFPIDNLKVKNDTIKILNENKIVKIGHKLHYEVDYEKLIDVSSMLSKGILVRDKYYIFEKPILTGIDQGKHIITASFDIPNTDFVLGKSKLIIKVEYVLFGGLRTLYDEAESEEFTIIK